jgi:putative glutamine transport system substrate-binding protein
MTQTIATTREDYGDASKEVPVRRESCAAYYRGVFMSRRTCIPLVVTSLIILCLLWSPAKGTGTLQRVKTRGVLWVGIRMDSPPFEFIDVYGRKEGLDVDMAKELAQELFGNRDFVQFKQVTSEDRIQLLKAGEVDVVIATGSVSEGRRAAVDTSIPYFASGYLILERVSDSICCCNDLRGKTIATVKGSADGAMICGPRFGAACVAFTTVSEAVRAVREGRADVFVEDDVVLIEAVKKNHDLKIAGWKPFCVHYYAVEVRKGDREWLGFINATLTKMKRTSEYGSLLRKWFGMLRGLVYERGLSSLDDMQ